MHIDNNDLEKFQNNTMNTEEIISFLEHLNECDFCMDQMILQNENAGIKAPGYLKEQILNKAALPEIRLAKTAAETSHKMQMFYFSLRTAAGVLAALLLLFTVVSTDYSYVSPIPSDYTVQAEQITQKKQQEIEKIISQGNFLNNFTRGIGHEITSNTGSITNHLNTIPNKLLNGGK